MKRWFIFLGITLPIVALLYFSLTRDPRELPCALLDKPAPQFTLVPMEGGAPVALAALKGSPVVLNFWSTWCGACAAEHDLIRRTAAQYESQGVRFYSVLYSDTVANVRAFTREYGKAVPVLLDPDLRAAIDYGVAGVPETFFIDRNGIVRYKQAGPLTPGVVAKQLRMLIGD